MASLNLCKRQLLNLQNLRFNFLRSLYCTSTSTLSSPQRQQQQQEPIGKKLGEWVVLPPFSLRMDPSSVGRAIMGRNLTEEREPITAMIWVRRCCPHLPGSLIQKLFRLRQVRMELVDSNGVCAEPEDKQIKVKRVSAKHNLGSGDVILLPITVKENITKTKDKDFSRKEIDGSFIRNLVLYKDPALIVINKPPGMAVQGGIGIKDSIDSLGSMSLKFDYKEPPRLVHRLDRESSGVLVLGRTETSAAILHSIFREKTSGAKANDIKHKQEDRALQKKYWALVIGTPKLSKGIIDAPILKKIVSEDGKSVRLVSQHALTEYKVIRSAQGYSWLELRPITGRKHQVRIHCAEVLDTPVVGDYKYGCTAHKILKPMPRLNPKTVHEKLPFNLESKGGSICDKRPRLHLHCREMIMPNIFNAVQQLEDEPTSSSSTNIDLSEIGMLELVAPIPFVACPLSSGRPKLSSVV